MKASSVASFLPISFVAYTSSALSVEKWPPMKEQSASTIIKAPFKGASPKAGWT
jgi:hypothetical protein